MSRQERSIKVVEPLQSELRAPGIVFSWAFSPTPLEPIDSHPRRTLRRLTSLGTRQLLCKPNQWVAREPIQAGFLSKAVARTWCQGNFLLAVKPVRSVVMT